MKKLDKILALLLGLCLLSACGGTQTTETASALAAETEFPAETEEASDDLTGTALPALMPAYVPDGTETKGFYWIVRMPDGADRLAFVERAEELDRLIGDAVRNGEEDRQSDFSSSERINLDFYYFYDAENGAATSLGPGYYTLYADESCVHGISYYASYEEKLRLPAGTYQAVLDFVSDLPTLDEALAACVRARPSGGDGTYSYDLFNLEGNYVQGVGPYGKPLEIGFTDSLFRILIVLRGSAGPERSAKWSVYYDPIGGTLSESFCNVLMETPEMILCGELDGVGIYDPMSGELFNRITDFSEPLAPTADSPFLSAGYTEEGDLSVTYLAGEDYHEATDRYELTSTSAQRFEYTLLPVPEP